MSRSVPPPRDAETVLAVRPPAGRQARRRGTLGGPRRRPRDEPRVEIGSPYRAGRIVAGRYRLVGAAGTRGDGGGVARAST